MLLCGMPNKRSSHHEAFDIVCNAAMYQHDLTAPEESTPLARLIDEDVQVRVLSFRDGSLMFMGCPPGGRLSLPSLTLG
jgi:hypothetical protein